MSRLTATWPLDGHRPPTSRDIEAFHQRLRALGPARAVEDPHTRDALRDLEETLGELSLVMDGIEQAGTDSREVPTMIPLDDLIKIAGHLDLLRSDMEAYPGAWSHPARSAASTLVVELAEKMLAQAAGDVER